MRRKRIRVQYYGGDTSRTRRGDRIWLPFVIIAVAALVLALIVGAILGGLAKNARLSATVHKDLTDFGGVENPVEKYGDLIGVRGDVISHDGMSAKELRRAIDDLQEGDATALLLYDGDGGVGFESELPQKSGIALTVKAQISAETLADTVRGEDRHSIGFFVTGAFCETDEQLRILRISEEIALLREIAGAGIREVVIFGLPTDSDTVAEVSSYVRQAREVCGETLVGVAVSSSDAASSGISRLVACTEAYTDSYFLDLRDVSEGQLGGYVERNAYFLTAYRMRLVLAGSDRDALVKLATTYGVLDYLIEP